jgi:hypothetical protein
MGQKDLNVFSFRIVYLNISTRIKILKESQ